VLDAAGAAVVVDATLVVDTGLVVNFGFNVLLDVFGRGVFSTISS